MPVVVSPEGQRLLDDLPPFVASDNTVQAALHAMALEIKRLDEARDLVQRNLWPQTASELLSVYEGFLNLSIAPPDKTLEQRRTTVLAYLQSLSSSGAGSQFQRNLSALIGSNWSYLEHDPDDGNTPAGNVLAINLPFTEAMAPPIGVSAVAGAGGSGDMLADTYRYAVTARNFFGETTVSEQVQTTVPADGSATISWAAREGATSYSIYRGFFVNALHRIGTVTGLSFVDDGTVGEMEPPPTQNSTESFQAQEAFRLARKITPAHLDLQFNYGSGFIIGVGKIGVTPL
jgi:hypothetical protein